MMKPDMDAFTDKELIGELQRRREVLLEKLRLLGSALGMDVAGPVVIDKPKFPAMSKVKKAYWDQARQEADKAGISVSELLKSRREAEQAVSGNTL
jgi:hypothetical protein